MSQSVYLVIILGFCVGVVWRTMYDFSLDVVVWLMVLAFAVAVVWRKKIAREKVLKVGQEKGEALSLVALLISLLFFTIALGILRTDVAAQQFDKSPLELSLDEKVILEGVVSREPDYREQSLHLYVEIEEDTVLVTTDRLNKVSYGDRVEFAGKLERPVEFETDLGRVFDYPGYLRAHGVEYRVSFAEVKVVGREEGNFIIAGLLKLKSNFIHQLQKIIPEPAVGLGNGLLLGVKSALGEDIERDFRRTGIIHIVVLSGYNVMLVVAFILFCLSFLLPLRARVAVGVLAIVAFALIVGLSATVVRASMMAVLVLLAQVLGRRYDVFRALLFAGVVMLLINPYLLVYDIGFQLSFMATLGLVLVVPKLESSMLEKGGWFGLRQFFLATIATQIAVLPLLLYHMGEVSIIAVVVNMLVLPVVSVAMLFTFLTGLISFASISLASVVGYIATLTLKYILLVASWFGSLAFATVMAPVFPAVGIFVLYASMLISWMAFDWWRKNPRDKMIGWVIEEEFD